MRDDLSERGSAQFVTNIEKKWKEDVLAAIRKTAAPCWWSDTPDGRMPATMAANYGSIWKWKGHKDLSEFWCAFDAVRGRR
ncbi:MAG: hypothetical protein E6Q97_04305 [Desulfurellales bacterium]|nr:MAG: hypothetical protein E6Q97_04305 [Desulfurellales bacterium]